MTVLGKIPRRSRRDEALNYLGDQAFTRRELLIILAIVAVLVPVIIQNIIYARKKAHRVACANQLMTVAFPISNLSSQNNIRSLQPGSADDEILKFLRSFSTNIANPKVLACPSDTRKAVTNWSSFTRQNVGYFLATDLDAENFPGRFLAGDRNISSLSAPFSPGVVKIPFNLAITWTPSQHEHQGNVAMGDGSVQQLSNFRLRERWANSGLNEQTFLFP